MGGVGGGQWPKLDLSRAGKQNWGFGETVQRRNRPAGGGGGLVLYL